MDGLTVGGTLAGYRIESVIGRGGMSVVYLAEHMRLGRKVTLKVLAPDLAADPTFRERFVRESRTAAALDHPNIVPIYEADEVDGFLFIAMRYVRGTDLQAVIRREGPLSLDRTASIITQVASALDAAHAEGLVHRDVKPANILLAPVPDAADHAYLSDFGITKRLSSTTSPTRSGDLMGSVDYSAPEQIEGRELDGRADVYSLGCVLYQCLAGTVPFPRDDDVAVLWAHIRDKPPSAMRVRPDLPAGVDAVIAKAMAKKREERYARCGQLSSALSKEAAHSTGGARPASPLRRRGRRRILVSAAVAAATVVALAAWLALSSGGGHVLRLSVRRIDPLTNEPTDEFFRAPADSIGLAVTEGAVLTMSPTKLTRVYPGPTKVLHLPFTATAIEAGAGQLWVGGHNQAGLGVLWQVDPRLLEPRSDPIFINEPVRAMAIGFGGVWVVDSKGLLSHVRPPGTLPPDLIPTQFNVRDVAIGASQVWALSERGGSVVRVSPQTRRPSSHVISVGRSPVAIDAGGAGVWVLDPRSVSTLGIDPEAGVSEDWQQVGFQPFDLVVEKNDVWVANAKSVTRVEPGSGNPHVDVGKPVLAITADESNPAEPQIWILVSTNPG